MSFRIDLAVKDGVHIFLVVVRDQINIHFQAANNEPDAHKPFQMRQTFDNMLGNFSISHYTDMIRGKDPEHVKRHHVIQTETKIPHMHLSFDIDVNPAILQEFFAAVRSAQKRRPSIRFQFFDEDTINHTLTAFSQYYQEFSGSEIEKQYLEERKLTTSEKESLFRSSQTLFAPSLTRADKAELQECGFQLNSDHERPSTETIHSDHERPSTGLFSFLFLLMSQGNRGSFIVRGEEETTNSVFEASKN